MVRISSLGGLLTAIRLQLGGVPPLTKCPGDETSYTGPSGLKYALCPATNFVGRSALEIPGIASTPACAARCDADATCRHAVYDTKKHVCHIKPTERDATEDWTADARYDAVQLANDLPEGTNVAFCPFAEQTVKVVVQGGGGGDGDGDGVGGGGNGDGLRICPHTDYWGKDLRKVGDVADTAACAQLCAAADDCEKATFDHATNTCHVKNTRASPGTMIWVLNKPTDTIHVAARPDVATAGNWSDLIRLPLIPVAVYVVPEFPAAKRLMAWSSFGPDVFGTGGSGRTQFADYNFVTGDIGQRTVANTHHDMFCPGVSMLADGRVIITGGSDANNTSIYDPATNEFAAGPYMRIARGYQSSTTLSDGRVFTIGGSFSGGKGGKDGEVYDPAADAWTLLRAAAVRPMLTTDKEGIYRDDNHAWLYGWRNASVFQAGPSKAMHWYGTRGHGSVLAAGTRDELDDAMCGVNVMYDALAGKILAAGGSPDYTDSDANARAHVITIGDVGAPAESERVPDMHFPRAFANIVVLPDGKSLVTGGQTRALVFEDTDGVLAPELFDPVKKTWTLMAPEAVARNYHSESILLPDGTVWSGGGGMCWIGKPGGPQDECDKTVDHPDGQIFSPPYLFDKDGTPAARPVVTKLSAARVKVGGTFSATTNPKRPAAASWALVRIGTATHSINTDQRRVPLIDVKTTGATSRITLPDDSGVVLPGMYYLFALSEAGVPSWAMTVNVVL